ncbi:nitrite/sulfite reductase [Erythrobacter sp. BLCC-B19]|uniref:nitrite/sulfite reductase n=1 Tax=Erythrobacter sp. BLCC-B19 TaxID=3025315 RepID=UPI00235F9755|nr:nitrite/sulfite reductase [Erythrobacter sp. BLCC-B19]WDA39978.1 nitrite/sulfite reductase [Erythrobacter sp. BLCC-B19]
MYRYDQYDQAMVDARVAEFRDQARRRLEGKLTEDQFKPLRLMNGLYLQLHAYMLRVAIPYGTLDARQMEMLADIADRYDRGYGHFTTRQNIQYNWIKLEDCADALADLATVEMHAIQTSGNCIRNISSDHFAGAAADEVVDPRPYAELMRQWSSFHPEFTYLPRKFKIAVIASEKDRAAMRLHDIGVRIVKRDGEVGAEFYAGGGMGRTPMIAPLIRDFVPIDQFITYAEACLRVYNRYGRRDNKYKARIKILVHELGAAEYIRQVEEEFAHLLSVGVEPPREELARITEYFAPPAFVDGPKTVDRSDPDFALWVDRNTHRHKHDAYVSAVISLKPAGGIPGDATSEQMRVVARLAREYSFDELRVMHTQNLLLPHVAIADLPAVWRALDGAGLGSPNMDTIEDIIACPGLDYCSLANARSIPLAQRISERFAETGRTEVVGELKLKISGCINACGHHHAGHIGILGVDKKGVENYQLSLGGSEAEDVSLAKITGPGFDEDGVIAAVEKVTDVYLASRAEGERFLDTYRRIGMEPFKEALYG